MCVDNGLWRVIVCMLFFPLLYTCLITFRYFLQLGHACNEAGWEKMLWHLPGWLSPTSTLVPHREKRLQPVGCLTRLRAFFTAPVVIFHMNILSYFTFLLLFAYVLMVDFQPFPSWREYLIYFWLFSLVCEETRQVWAGRAEAGRRREEGGGRHPPSECSWKVLHSSLSQAASHVTIHLERSQREGLPDPPVSGAGGSPWLCLVWLCVLAERHAVLS